MIVHKNFFYSFLIFVFVIFGCSNTSVIDSQNGEIETQYLEELESSTKSNAIINAKLAQLNLIQENEYKIGPGDVFHISVFDEPDLEIENVLVKPDGSITFKLIGEIFVAGKTVSEATFEMEKLLKKYLIHPKVTMTSKALKSAQVTILGKVTHPGVYEIDSKTRILDIIAQAGGLAMGYFQSNSTELADLERSYIIRDNEVLPVNFMELINNGNMLHNIPLKDNDYIYLPSTINREIYVLGEVNEPGHFAYKEKMTVLQVLSFAQGMKDTSQNTIFIVRGGITQPRLFKVNIKDILRIKERDFLLKPNDIVFVPKNNIATWNQVMNSVIPTLQVIQGGWVLKSLSE